MCHMQNDDCKDTYAGIECMKAGFSDHLLLSSTGGSKGKGPRNVGIPSTESEPSQESKRKQYPWSQRRSSGRPLPMWQQLSALDRTNVKWRI